MKENTAAATMKWSYTNPNLVAEVE